MQVREIKMPDTIEVGFQEFVSAVSPQKTGHIWIAGFKRDPDRNRNWGGEPLINGWDPTGRNAYMSQCTMKTMNGRTVENSERLLFIILDDISDISNFPIDPSWILETSPNNHQVGFLIIDGKKKKLATKILHSLAGTKGADKGGNNLIRYARIPGGVNNKSHVVKENGGVPFECALKVFNKDNRYTLRKFASAFNIDTTQQEYKGSTGGSFTSLEDDEEKVRSCLDHLNSEDIPDSIPVSKSWNPSGFLNDINKDSDGYDFWYRVGMAIHSTGLENGFELWDEWSSQRSKYEGESKCRRKWKSFNENKDRKITIASLYKAAMETGWHYSSEEEIHEALKDAVEINVKEKEDTALDLIHAMPCEPLKQLALEYLRVGRYPQPEFALGTALTIGGFLIGRTVASKGKMTNMQSTFISPSGFGKNDIISTINIILKETDLIGKLLKDIPSAEGVEDALYDDSHHMGIAIIDEAEEKKMMADSRHRKMAAKLRELNTSGAMTYVCRRKANNPDDSEPRKTMYAPFLTLIEATTDNSYRKALQADTVGEGTVGRTIYFITKEELSKFNEQSEILDFTTPPAFDYMASIVTEWSRSFENNPNEIPKIEFDKKTLEQYFKDEHEKVRIYNGIDKSNDLKKQLLVRSLEHTKQISMILAVWNDELSLGNQIRLVEYTWAKRFMLWSRKNTYEFLADNITVPKMEYNAEFKSWHRAVKEIVKGGYDGLSTTDQKSYGDCVRVGLIPKPLVIRRCKIRNSKNLAEYESIAKEADALEVNSAKELLKKRMKEDKRKVLKGKRVDMYIVRSGFNKLV